MHSDYPKPQSAKPVAIRNSPNPQSGGGLGLAVNRPVKGEKHKQSAGPETSGNRALSDPSVSRVHASQAFFYT